MGSWGCFVRNGQRTLLNQDYFYAPLRKFLEDSKQGRAKAKQWLNTIKSAPGIKTTELGDLGIIPWIESKGDEFLRREEIMEYVLDVVPYVFENVLSRVEYKRFSHELKGQSDYKEILYTLGTRGDMWKLRIHDLRYEIEQLAIDMSWMDRDPQALTRLENEMADIHARIKSYVAPQWSHFSGAHNELGNVAVLGHIRVSVSDETFFINEIQSDWAQRGRSSDFRTNAYPPGPFVTDTQVWAGLLMRRALQLAAASESQQVAWIRGADMVNGGSMRGPSSIDDFYQKVVTRIAEKAVKGAGKVEFVEVETSSKSYKVAGIKMTDQVRAKLSEKQPFYSWSDISAVPKQKDDPIFEAVVRDAKDMLGSLASVRLINRLYDVSTGKIVAGRYVNRMVEIALEAKDPRRVGWHECFHAGMELLATEDEKDMILQVFWPEGPLNERVRQALIEAGDHRAAQQCSSAEEAAAHAFSMWKDGSFTFPGAQSESGPVERVFVQIKSAVTDFLGWCSKRMFGQRYATPESFFEALASGDLLQAHLNGEDERVGGQDEAGGRGQAALLRAPRPRA